MSATRRIQDESVSAETKPADDKYGRNAEDGDDEDKDNDDSFDGTLYPFCRPLLSYEGEAS